MRLSRRAPEERHRPRGRDTRSATGRGSSGGLTGAQRTIEPGSDRAGLRYFLLEAAKLPAGQRIAAVDKALAATGKEGVDAQIEALLDRLYGGTKIGDLATASDSSTSRPPQLEARNDAMLDFAAALRPTARREREARTGAIAAR